MTDRRLMTAAAHDVQEEVVSRILKVVHPQRIVLFGSAARHQT